MTNRNDIELYVRERFESGLRDLIDAEIERTREDREEALGGQIEERLREEFEEEIEDLIDAELFEEDEDEDDAFDEEEAS